MAKYTPVCNLGKQQIPMQCISYKNGQVTQRNFNWNLPLCLMLFSLQTLHSAQDLFALSNRTRAKCPYRILYQRKVEFSIGGSIVDSTSTMLLTHLAMWYLKISEGLYSWERHWMDQLCNSQLMLIWITLVCFSHCCSHCQGLSKHIVLLSEKSHILCHGEIQNTADKTAQKSSAVFPVYVFK